MFKNFTREFEEDPFFGNFPSQFGSLDVIGKEQKCNKSKTKNRNHDPFQSLFEEMDKHMKGMHERANSLEGDPSSYTFSSSSVMSYKNDGKSPPKIYQASTSTRRAPGQIRETRKTLRDSATGVEKMAVGQHLGHKGRVIEQTRNHGSNIKEERQYIEMDEADNQIFDKEWKERASKIAIPSFERTGIGSSQYHKKPEKTRQTQHNSGVTHAARPYGPSKTGRHKL